MCQDLETSLTKEFPHYLVKVSQVKKFFQKCRGKILNEKIKQLFDIVENVSKSIYYNHGRNCKETTVIITSIF